MIKEYSEDINHYIDTLREFAKAVLPEKLFDMLKIDNFEHFYEEDKLRIIKATLQALKFFYLEKPEFRKAAIDHDKAMMYFNLNIKKFVGSFENLVLSFGGLETIIKKIEQFLLLNSDEDKQNKKIIN